MKTFRITHKDKVYNVNSKDSNSAVIKLRDALRIEELINKGIETINKIDTKKKHYSYTIKTDILETTVFEQEHGKPDKRQSGKLEIIINWEKDYDSDLGWFIIEGNVLIGNGRVYVTQRNSDSKQGAISNLKYVIKKLKEYIK